MIEYKTILQPNKKTDNPKELPAIANFILKVAPMFPAVNSLQKLLFYNNFLLFLKTISLHLIAKNKLELELKNGLSSHSTNRIETSFFGLLLQYNIVEKRDEKLFLKPPFNKFSKNDWEYLLNLQDKNIDNTAPSSHTKILAKNYSIVITLIQLYRKNELIKNSDKTLKHWHKLIQCGQLDYEIRLSETLLGLNQLQLPYKIQSPFDDDYYTESGRNAFNNFTKIQFQRYVKFINEKNSIQTILDVGCGYGNYIESLSNQLPKATITGVELQQKVFNEAQKRFSNNQNIQIINTNIFNYKPNQQIDLILFNYVLFYFSNEDKERLFTELFNQLSNNGSILICQYYSNIENLKEALAKAQGENGFSKRIERYFGDKILYANALWNESSDAFVQSEIWTEFEAILHKTGFKIVTLTNADKFYYSLFVEIKKQ